MTNLLSHANSAFSVPFRSWHAKDGSFGDGYSSSTSSYGSSSFNSNSFVPGMDSNHAHHHHYPTTRSRGYDSSADKVHNHFMNDGRTTTTTDFHLNNNHRIGMNAYSRHSPMTSSTSHHTKAHKSSKSLKPLQTADHFMESHLCKNESDPSNLFDFELLRGVINARVGMKVASPDTIPCKYGPKCFRKDCRFSHKIPREFDLLSFSLLPGAKPTSPLPSTAAESPDPFIIQKLSPMANSVSSSMDTDDSLDLDFDTSSPCSTARLSSEETRCPSVLSDSCAHQDSDGPDL